MERSINSFFKVNHGNHSHVVEELGLKINSEDGKAETWTPINLPPHIDINEKDIHRELNKMGYKRAIKTIPKLPDKYQIDNTTLSTLIEGNNMFFTPRSPKSCQDKLIAISIKKYEKQPQWNFISVQTHAPLVN